MTVRELIAELEYYCTCGQCSENDEVLLVDQGPEEEDSAQSGLFTVGCGDGTFFWSGSVNARDPKGVCPLAMTPISEKKFQEINALPSLE